MSDALRAKVDSYFLKKLLHGRIDARLRHCNDEIEALARVGKVGL